jgi:hypothetical protein
MIFYIFVSKNYISCTKISMTDFVFLQIINKLDKILFVYQQESIVKEFMEITENTTENITEDLTDYLTEELTDYLTEINDYILRSPDLKLVTQCPTLYRFKGNMIDYNWLWKKRNDFKFMKQIDDIFFDSKYISTAILEQLSLKHIQEITEIRYINFRKIKYEYYKNIMSTFPNKINNDIINIIVEYLYPEKFICKEIITD